MPAHGKPALKVFTLMKSNCEEDTKIIVNSFKEYHMVLRAGYEFIETFSIRLFHGKPQTANLRMSRDRGLTVAFEVCSSRLNGRRGFQR